MESSAEIWPEPNTNPTISGSSSIQVLKDSIGSDKNGGRRSSDGGPPPFNRTRSFKTKQLVRSQAIRESQSPPRVPSPRPSTLADTKENKLAAIRIKSASVDLDDRLSYEHAQTTIRELSSNETVLQDKTGISDDAISLTYSDSFKNNNISTKDILVSTSGDKQNLGANVVSICSSTSESINKNKPSSETVNGKSKSNISTDTTDLLKNHPFPHNKVDKNESSSPNSCVNSECTLKNSQYTLPAIENNSSSIDIDSNKLLDSHNNNDNQCLSLDIRLDIVNDSNPCAETQKFQNTECSSQEYQMETVDVTLEPLQSSTTDVNCRKQKVTLKNLKNSNYIKNNDNSPLIIHEVTHLKNKETCYHRNNMPKVEVHQVEIQVTAGEQNKNSNKHCDCGIGPSIDEDEAEIEDSIDPPNKVSEGRRAICPSKQDSGVCCWDSYCGDNSPEILTSDNEEEPIKMRKKISMDMDHQPCISNDVCSRCSEKVERQPNRRNGSMLTVQRASSGGNPRLLRKQSSGGSIDSGQHSITSPFLSRDNSSEIFNLNPCDIGELSKFIKDTLNKNQKDRITLLKIEHELILFVRDPTRKEHKFPATSSYGRLLVHRCADLFGLRHGVDPATRHVVTVAKLPQGGVTYRIPLICPFQQWCSAKFPASPTGFCETIPQAKSILKRDTHSLDEEAVMPTPAPPKLLQTPRSKSFEQREEEYVKARRRIFSSPGQEDGEMSWDWEENQENEEETEICPPRILVPDGNKSARLLKVQSLEHDKAPINIRGVVSKAHSFGGYGGRQGVQRGDSISSTSSAPPHRILSRQGELASTCWRLSPSSSGYKTLSGRSDSVTPSPTSTPNTATTDSSTGKNTDLKVTNNATSNGVSHVLWAITDMSNVPSGAVIIHPQTGQALTNCDGSIYHYDPEKPLHSALLPPIQISSENVRVLSNPERRRRLEKQRATLSPGTEYHINFASENKSVESDQPSAHQENKLDIVKILDSTSISLKKDSENPDSQDINEIDKHKESFLPESMSPSEDGVIHENSKQNSESISNKINTTCNNNSEPISSITCVSKVSPGHNVIDTVSHNNKNNMYSRGQSEDNTEHSFIQNQNRSLQEIKSDKSKMTIKGDSKETEKVQYEQETSTTQMQNYEQAEENHNKLACVEFDPNVDDRPIANYVPAAYSEIPDPRYYDTIIQGTPPQYYASGHLYDGNSQEVYSNPQPLNYNVRNSETSIGNTMPQHPMSHPHLIFAPPADTTFTNNGEICYPAPPAQVLIPPPPYRLHEPETQPPQYHVISTDQHSQPVMVALSNKLPEHEITQPITGYPQVERAPVIASPQIVGLAASHPPLGYQFQTSSGWGCWPQMVYAPQQTTDDGIYKFQPNSGTFIPQHNESTINPQGVSALPPTYFPHPNFIPSQPNQYFQPYPHHTPMVQHQFPIYQQYNPGRSSVLSQEGCSTPGFQTYDSHMNTFNFHKPGESMYAESANKNPTNVKSPKLCNSRTASNSGSSRTTPLTSNLPIQNMGICDVNFSNADQNVNVMNNVHFVHPAVNYIPFSYPYVNPVDLTQNHENLHSVNLNKSLPSDNQNFIKYNKQIIEAEKYISVKNSKQNPPLIQHKNESFNVSSHDKGDKLLKQGIISSFPDKTDNSHGKNNSNILTSSISFDLKSGNRNKDKRKSFKPTNSLSIDIETNYDQIKSPVKEKSPLIQNYHVQHPSSIKPNFTNDKIIPNQNRNIQNRSENDSKKNQYMETRKQIAPSSLSNDAKTFIPKNTVTMQTWNTKENTAQTQNEIDHPNHMMNKHLNSQVITNSNNGESNYEHKNSWRKNQNYVQKDYHNFPKNFNRQINRNNVSNNAQLEKNTARNSPKDKPHHNENQQMKMQSTFDASQQQVTPTMLNAPSTPWTSHTPNNIILCNNQNTAGNSSAFTMPNLSQPPPLPLRQMSQSNESPASSTSNTPSLVPKTNMTKMQIQNNTELCVTQRFIDTNMVGLPLAQSAAFYQRTQTMQNLAAGGIGLVQTPPLHGHSAYFLRQVPSGWFRRPTAPALFGPGPALSGQIRARPPRPHQMHPRHFYH